MTPIRTQADDELRMIIAQPSGWEQTTVPDFELFRFAMVNRSLIANDFATIATVLLESEAGRKDPTSVFDKIRKSLVTVAGATDLVATDGTLCGHTAQTIHYAMPARGRAPVHSATDVTAVVHTNGNTYAASLGIQTAVAIDPVYQRDAEAILTGFQVLAPTG